jgi:shikimate dehydrogenase
MFPNVNAFPQLSYEYISSQHYFFDLIYNPAKTLFLSKAEERGAVIENGEKMLAIQAEESWTIWNKV